MTPSYGAISTMKHSSLPAARRLSLFPLRRSLRALPLLLLNGAIVQVANAQTTGAQPAPSELYSLVSTLSVFAFFALLVGLFRPKTFAFLFKEKATRGPVCGVFGAAWLFLVVLSGPLRPKPVATAANPGAASVAAPGKNESAVRAAESRAKSAEARAVRAEKAAASANANAKSGSAGGGESAAPEPKAAPKDESLASNVEVVDIEGVGKREVGVVDDVVYVVGKAETAKTLGSDMYRREADGVFYVLQVGAENTDKKTHNVTTAIMKLVDDQEREFDSSSEGSMALSMAGEQSAEPFSAQLQPGLTKRFTLVFDVPSDAKGLKLKIPAGGFGFGKSATLKVPTASE